jgi:uncharacterized peroxidase-related enzyme|tara:strand:- start:86 stop:697 length:612 start_codon:yes stop_codon:yes gene_type:complete
MKSPCWIETIDPNGATSELNEMYQHVGSVHNRIHNLYRAFSLQPKPMISADQHYRDILHNEANHTESWFLELLASQAAVIANCHYALENHGANFKKLLGNDELGERMLSMVRKDDFYNNSVFTSKQAALLVYGAKLCRTPQLMSFKDVETLREAGVTDTEILEAVQATACFAYWVRFINALGISLGDEKIGLYNHSDDSTSSP